MVMQELLQKAGEEFRKLDDSPIRIITHLDADGISSAAILARAFQSEKKKFVISVIRQLDEKKLREIARESYKAIFFTDLGSGSLNLIKQILQKKQVFILDHHLLEKDALKDNESGSQNIIHVNPFLTNNPSSYSELSGSSVTYLFARELSRQNKCLAHIALIGMMGDMHDINLLDTEITRDAIESGELEVKKGLKMFGTQTKPLKNLLRYSIEPYIPGVTGDESGTSSFLAEIGITSEEERKKVRFVDLNEEQAKRLITGIILRRMGSEENPEDILGDVYLLKSEEEGNPTRDIKEFATLLNACGRLGKSSIGILACMGNKNAKERALQVLQDYKQELVDVMNWFYRNKGDTRVVMEKGRVVLVNAQDNVRETMIGTLASMLSKSGMYQDSTTIISMANTIDGNIKISTRIVGSRRMQDAGNEKKEGSSAVVNAREMIDGILAKIGGGTSGGHDEAAGALIPQEKEQCFIEKVLEIGS
jgi:RecJ-like exonuclease